MVLRWRAVTCRFSKQPRQGEIFLRNINYKFLMIITDFYCEQCLTECMSFVSTCISVVDRTHRPLLQRF